MIIVVFGLLFFVSCGKTQKENTPQKKVKKTKVTVSKKEKTTKKKSAVVVDSEGVANVTISSNDGMRFDVRKINVSAGQKVRLTLNHTGKLD